MEMGCACHYGKWASPLSCGSRRSVGWELAGTHGDYLVQMHYHMQQEATVFSEGFCKFLAITILCLLGFFSPYSFLRPPHLSFFLSLSLCMCIHTHPIYKSYVYTAESRKPVVNKQGQPAPPAPGGVRIRAWFRGARMKASRTQAASQPISPPAETGPAADEDLSGYPTVALL